MNLHRSERNYQTKMNLQQNDGKSKVWRRKERAELKQTVKRGGDNVMGTCGCHSSNKSLFTDDVAANRSRRVD